MHGMGTYEFAQTVTEDGKAWGFSLKGFTLTDDGYVYAERRKSPVGLWYAQIGNHPRPRTIRRDKLNDVAMIEDFRWRVHLRHKVLHGRWRTVFEEGKKLGRIWHPRDECFHVYSDQGSLSRERDVENASVIDRIAQIPTPAEEEAGRRYVKADTALYRSWARIHFATALLKHAFAIAGPTISAYDPPQPRTSPVIVKHLVNGREYVHHTPTGWGAKTVKIWPTPWDFTQTREHSAVVEKKPCEVCRIGVRVWPGQVVRCEPCRTARREIQVRARK